MPPPKNMDYSDCRNDFNPLERSWIHRSIPVRALFLFLLFIVFLSPLSFQVRGDNVSANYSFIFFPFILLISGQKLIIPSNQILMLGLAYSAIFLITLSYQTAYYDFWDRRLISFVLFISIFTFFIINIDAQMFRCFKYALVCISILYSLNSFYTYFAAGGATLGYDIMRPIVQSQRYGFILLVALWLVFLFKPSNPFQLLTKYLFIFILINGLGLTFSRSSVAGLLTSSAFYLCLICFRWYKNPTAPTYLFLKKFFLGLSLSILVGFLSYLIFPDYFEFFSLRLLKINISAPFTSGYFPYPSFPNYDTYVYDELESSEGYRLYMIRQVFSYLSDNPFFGAGFLGVWVMFADLNGAAHNQLLDVLFRTGIVGFLIYLYFIGRILIRLFKANEIALLCGLVGVLAIGMFHETFKLSQGSFLFAFLVAVAFKPLKELNQNPH